MSEWIQHPVITNEELAIAKYKADSILQTRTMETDFLLNERRNKLFEKYGLQQTISLLQSDNIKRCTREKFIEYRNQFFRPQNCIIIVHGKVNKFDIISKINFLFNNWNLPELSVTEKSTLIRLPLSTQSLIGTTSAQYPTLQYCFPGPSYKSNTIDYYAGKVLSSLLNNNAHLFKYSLGKRISFFEFETEAFNIQKQSFFTFNCILPPEQLRKAYDTLNVWVNNLSGFIKDDYQLADAKRRTYQLYENKTAATYDQLNLLAVHWANDLLNEYYQAENIIRKLTAADLQNYISRYITEKPSARFLLISPAHQDATNSRTFFNDFESYDDLTIYFDRNSELISTSSENAFYKAVQFLKINRMLGSELTVYQDVDERKDLVRKRYAVLYTKLYAEGISETVLDEMNVNLYVAAVRSQSDKFKNQRAVFSKPKQ
jgi:predicted Zn-dependent peptidase